MTKISKEKLEELQSAAGDRELVVFESQYAAVVFKIPNGTEYDMYRSKIAQTRGQGNAEANKQLLKTCLAYPAFEEFKSYLDKRPHLLEKWADKLTDAAGAAEEIEVSKL